MNNFWLMFEAVRVKSVDGIGRDFPTRSAPLEI